MIVLQNIVDVDLYIPVYKLSISLGHPCDYSNLHVRYFIIAISMQEKQHILVNGMLEVSLYRLYMGS